MNLLKILQEQLMKKEIDLINITSKTKELQIRVKTLEQDKADLALNK